MNKEEKSLKNTLKGTRKKILDKSDVTSLYAESKMLTT